MKKLFTILILSLILTACGNKAQDNKKEEDKHGKTVLWALAIVGTVAAIAAIAYAVYCFFTPDYLEDFEEDFDDDFDDYFEDEEE